MKSQYDLTIIGGGIVGAATAWQMSKTFPNRKILLLEKESGAAFHQTGRNSGVIHAGIYYQPGSLKAKYCRAGLEATIDFCQQYGIAYDRCGKLLVATTSLELQRMENLFQRGTENGLDVERISSSKLNQLEPNITGQGALLVNDTGITNYSNITASFLELFKQNGGEVRFNQEVQDLTEKPSHIQIQTQNEELKSGLLLNCSGLMSDRLIKMLGLAIDFQIVPFRGEYFKLPDKYNRIISHLIYPIPDPALPFLGVHLTRMIDGSITVGPNAVLALAREGYAKTDVNWSDIAQNLRFGGFWGVVWKHRKSALKELKNSVFKNGYLQQVRKYCPQLSIDDLLPYPSGIRAQAVDHSGELIHDFKFIESDRSLHVGNAPSPAATSAIPIAKAIVERMSDKFG